MVTTSGVAGGCLSCSCQLMSSSGFSTEAVSRCEQLAIRALAAGGAHGHANAGDEGPLAVVGRILTL